jgi:hypothetical protein
LKNAYVFGDKIFDHNFCDMILDCLMVSCRTTLMMPHRVMFDIFKLCCKDAPPRQLLIDAFVYGANDTWFKGSKAKAALLDEEAWREIATALIRKRNDDTSVKSAPWIINMCIYHWHTKEGGACYEISKVWSEAGIVR